MNKWLHRLTERTTCANCGESLQPGESRYVTKDGKTHCAPEHGCAPPVEDRVPVEPTKLTARA